MSKSKVAIRMDLTPTRAEDPENDEPTEWEIKDAADTLTRAEEIKKNKKLMPHVHKHITKKLNSLQDLKKLAFKKTQGEADDGLGLDDDRDGM